MGCKLKNLLFQDLPIILIAFFIFYFIYLWYFLSHFTGNKKPSQTNLAPCERVMLYRIVLAARGANTSY